MSSTDDRQYPAPQGNEHSTTGAPSGGELFVGLNLLSKVGIIFIIIGFIAFTAASEGIPELIRTVIILALGAVMAGAGEFFWRKGSAVFSRALVFGAIADWAIAIPLSFYGFMSINDIACAALGAAAAAAGFFLAWRYRSLSIAIVVFLCAFVPVFPAFRGMAGFFAGMAYLMVLQIFVLLLARDRDWRVLPYIGLFCNFVMIIAVLVAACSLFRKTELPESFPYIVSAVYTIGSYLIYTLYAVFEGIKLGGSLRAGEMTTIIVSQTITVIFSLSCVWAGTSLRGAGVAAAVITVLYLAAVIAFSRRCGDGCRLTVCFENMLLAGASLTIFMLIPGRVAYMVFHVFAAGVLFYGFFKKEKLFRVWGYALLSAAEFFFVCVCLPNIDNPIFIWQFILNAAVWTGIMAVYALRKREGRAFGVYSCAVLLNTGLLGVYLISSRLLGTLVRSGAIVIDDRGLFSTMFCAVMWMLIGFVAGKLRFMKKFGSAAALFLYFIGMCCLLDMNVRRADAENAGGVLIALTVLVNAVSVAAALDMALRIQSFAPKFARAVGLVVSGYGLLSLTVVLGSNHWVAFTSCIISIIYIAAAVAWIVFGFMRDNALLRRFGLALALLASAKLFLFDFREIGTTGRTLMFIGFGVTLLCISFAYGYFSKKLKERR